jgi:hypothetical protein
VTSPDPSVAAAPPRASASGGESAALSRDLGDFLIELAIALHKHSIYPPGHPLLTAAVSGLHRRLEPLLRERASLSLGVARHQLVIEGVATDAQHPVLRELAGKLHRHHLGAVRFQMGVLLDELDDMLATVALDAGRTNKPLGLETPESLARWPNVRLFPMTFEQLELLDDEPEQEEEEDLTTTGRRRAVNDASGTRAAQLWVGLARAALVHDQHVSESDDPVGAADPVVVAKAIDEHSRDVAYDQVVVGYLLQIAEELRTKTGREALALRKRISKLVASLKPATLRRLLEMGGDFGQRRRFVLDASSNMAVEAVVELIEAAAATSHQTISHSMMRLLSKFAAHAETGSTGTRPQADGALRDGVKRLLAEWQLEDPNPDAYRRTLEGMAHAPSVFETSEHAYPPEPERVVQMSLEAGAIGEATWRAVGALASRSDFAALLDLLDAAPPGHARDAVWAHVATAERLHAVLAAEPLQVALATRLIARMGVAAADPLLDALERANEQAARPIIELLAPLGADVLPMLVRRLEGARWVMQRRLLGVVARLPDTPEFVALPWLQHPDDGVRREALKVAMRSRTERNAALGTALLDSDPSMVRGALASALSGCPPEAVATIMRKVDDGSLAPELRSLGVRVVATLAMEDARDWLLRTAAMRGGMLRRVRLRPKSPEVVAAVEGLATHWRSDSEAAAVVALAARSDDAELRAASAPRRASVAMRAVMAEAIGSGEMPAVPPPTPSSTPRLA